MITEADASKGADLPAPRGRFLVGPRFAPGPLRPVKRSGPSGAAKGAVVGGLVGLVVLAALSLPLVLAQIDTRPGERYAEAPRPSPVRSAAVPSRPPAVQPVATEVASVEPVPVRAAYEPAPAPATQGDAGKPSRSSLSLDSLPTLTQEASDIDLDPAASPTAAPSAPRPPQRVAVQRRTAQPKPAQP